MSIPVPKFALLLLLLGGAWWMARGAGGDGDGDGSDAGGANTAFARALRPQLELAVTSAANAADCGYSEVGYGRRTPEEAARRLVAMMVSATAPAPGDEPLPPGPTVEYVEGRPTGAWQVAVRPDSAGTALLVEGFGPDLEQPMFTRRVPCS